MMRSEARNYSSLLEDNTTISQSILFNPAAVPNDIQGGI
jgi:hypothetical protein